MTDHANELRRLAQAALIGPDGVSLNWLKSLQDFQNEANPAAISELLDRLEVVEKDVALKEKVIDALGSELNAVAKEREMDEERIADLMADLNRVGHENDALRIELDEIRYGVAVAHDTIKALRAKVEAAENDAAHQKALAESALRVAEGWERTCGELRAKVEAMEKQEPVVYQRLYRDGSGTEDITDLPDVFERQRPLYALPGAKENDNVATN